MKAHQAILFALPALALLGCSAPAPMPVFADGNLGPVAPDLRGLEKSGFSRAWLRPDVSFASYRTVRLVYPEIKYRSPPRHSASGVFGQDNYSLSDGLAREFLSALEQSFRSELAAASGWRSAAGPEANEAQQTLEIRVSLVDLVVHVPLRPLASDTHAWVQSIGGITVVIDLYDASAHRIIARFAERRLIAPASGRAIKASPGASLFEARRIFLLWARNLRQLLEALESADVTAASHQRPVPSP